MSKPGIEIAMRLEEYSRKHPNLKLRLAQATKPKGLALMVSGDLESSNSADFLALAMETLPSAALAGGLSVELSHLGYISSTGVGALVTILTAAERYNLPFSLCAVPARTKSVFMALGLWSFFSVEETLREEE